MDINAVGIGAIFGAVLVSGTNLFIAQQNRKKDDIRERLEKFFLPMQRILNSSNAMENSYETLLKIEKIYGEHEHLASPQMALILADVLSEYHALLRENLTDKEIREKITTGKFASYKESPRILDELVYDINGAVAAGVSTLLWQYRGGFRVHFINFMQLFSSSPYSPKEWRRDYSGYVED